MTKRKSYDVAIVGLGAMGSATAYQLARRRSRSVVAFDQLTPPHAAGSTHGESRIIREAYFEHPLYVPIVQRSYECWNELEAESGEQMLFQTGGVLMGPERGALVSGSRLSADRHGLDYELLTPKEIRKRFPVFNPDDKTVGLYEPRAGFLLPEKCVQAHLQLAAELGAELHFDEPVVEWKPDGDGVRIKTQHDVYNAGQLVLAPGPWMSHFIPDLKLPLTIERQVLYWYDPARNADKFLPDKLGIYAWEYAPDALFYGFPNLGNGVKIALHHGGTLTDVDTIDRSVAGEEIAVMQTLIDAFVPTLEGPLLRTEVCMYTNTPDEHFIIDFHPDLPQVLIASPCSGHGFKFSAVIGEILADLLMDRKSKFDLSPFRVGRLHRQ